MDAKSHPGVRAGHGNESISPHTKTLYPSKSCSNQRRAIPFPRPFPSHLSSPAHLLLAPCTLPPSSPPKFTQPRKSRSHLSHSVALRSPPKITRPENPNLGRFSTEFYLFNGGTFIHARARAWLSLFFPLIRSKFHFSTKWICFRNLDRNSISDIWSGSFQEENQSDLCSSFIRLLWNLEFDDRSHFFFVFYASFWSIHKSHLCRFKRWIF